jgi:hypothetical protein
MTDLFTVVTSADSAVGSDSEHLSLGAIFGILGGLFALALILAIGFVWFRFRHSKHSAIPSSSDTGAPDESAESTLHQTLLPLSDSVTVNGDHAAPVFTFSSTLQLYSSLA